MKRATFYAWRACPKGPILGQCEKVIFTIVAHAHLKQNFTLPTIFHAPSW